MEQENAAASLVEGLRRVIDKIREVVRLDLANL